MSDRRDLHYREPAAIDVLLMSYPDSAQLVALAKAATDMSISLIQQGHDAGVLRRDFTADDRRRPPLRRRRQRPRPPRRAKPSREDYDRRTRFFLDGLRPR